MCCCCVWSKPLLHCVFVDGGGNGGCCVESVVCVCCRCWINCCLCSLRLLLFLFGVDVVGGVDAVVCMSDLLLCVFVALVCVRC